MCLFYPEELGIPLGSVRLYPTWIFVPVTTRSLCPAGRTGSPYEPSGAFGFYNNATAQNYQNFGFNTNAGQHPEGLGI